MNKLISMGEVESCSDSDCVQYARITTFERPFTSGRLSLAHVLLSYISCPADTKRPETMAFICDEDGDVMGWNELCVSYAPDHEAGMAECIEMLEAMR